MTSSASPAAIVQQDLGQICHQIIEQKRWTQFRDLQIVVEPTLSSFGAHITHAEWKIQVMVGEDFYDAVDTAIAEEKLPFSRTATIEKMMYATLNHEHGHFAHAPKTKEDLQNIITGIYRAIEGREYRMDSIQGLCFYIHNMYTDTILNTINAHTDEDPQRFRDGLALLYIVMNNYTKRMLGQKADKAHALFLSSNQILCQTNPDFYGKIQQFFPRFFASFSRYRSKIMDIFTGDREITKNAIHGELAEQDIGTMLRKMQDTSQWGSMAEEYALIIYPFLRQQLQWMESSYTRKQPSSGSGSSSGKQQGKKPNRPAQQGKGDKDNGNKDNGNKGNDGDDDDGKKIPQYNPGREIIKRLISESVHVPYTSPFLKQFKRLDRLYTQRAGRLALFAEEQELLSPHLEIPLGQEEMPLSEFSTTGIDWAATRIYNNKEGTKDGNNIQLYRRTTPLVLPIEVEEKQGGLPDLAWIFDSSTSMNFNPFDRDGQGEYHFAALTFYSMIKYLEEKGLAPLLNYYLANFSNKTHSSSWCSYAELNTVKRTLFDYQGQGTVLDPTVLRNLRETRRDNAICFMLSDTDFNFENNVDDLLKEIDEIQTRGGIAFYLFLLGGQPTSFSKGVEQRGLPVHPIKKAEDFLHAGIHFTKDFYGEVIRS